MKPETEAEKKTPMKVKWLEEALLLLGMLALSAGIAFLLYHFQEFFRISLGSYGWLVYLLVFTVSLLGSSTIFVPTPGIAVTLAAAAIWNPVLVGMAAGTGDALGEMTAYWAGYVGEKIIVDEHMPAYQKASAWMGRYGAWAVFGVALVPVVLFDLVGLAAGTLKMPWWKFLAATLCGKVPRAIVICSLGHQLPALLLPWHF
jgi:uncharacterized membrane protein YdjX (TVP38/TMEM64 family)